MKGEYYSRVDAAYPKGDKIKIQYKIEGMEELYLSSRWIDSRTAFFTQELLDEVEILTRILRRVPLKTFNKTRQNYVRGVLDRAESVFESAGGVKGTLWKPICEDQSKIDHATY